MSDQASASGAGANANNIALEAENGNVGEEEKPTEMVMVGMYLIPHRGPETKVRITITHIIQDFTS